MARPLRLEFPGALYHVTTRGNARGNIFLDDEDRQRYLVVLGATVTRFGWLCHGYCLMDNHYHLLIETPEPNLSQGMRQINGVYTQGFNRRHGRVGHVLQGRFKAILVERDSYLLELARYIVLNPVRAGMIPDAQRYRWSSYRAMAGLEAAPDWLTVDWVLGQFARQRAAAQRKYAQFVAQGKDLPSPMSAVKGQVLLGSESFVQQMTPLLDDCKDIKEITRAERLAHRPALSTLLPARACADKALRDQAIREAYLLFGYSMLAIARQANIHYSTVSKVIKGER
ncbi:MAG TPA: transposase [Burkholderiaceae bacterium]|nr:transposase [Burkholderiaceae bacterium]